jgi:hypothetical protein
MSAILFAMAWTNTNTLRFRMLKSCLRVISCDLLILLLQILSIIWLYFAFVLIIWLNHLFLLFVFFFCYGLLDLLLRFLLEVSWERVIVIRDTFIVNISFIRWHLTFLRFNLFSLISAHFSISFCSFVILTRRLIIHS